MQNFENFINEAGRVKPDEKQMKWFEMERYAFIHFGMNTFTDREWGDGTEKEELFNPSKIDCRQWARTLKETGFKGMILTCKHHDGFCLWPSKYTEHCSKKIDVVRLASDACREYGIKFGIYLSPWDRNSALYGTEKYNDYYCAQLEELLSNYGKIFCVWWDNACGEGPSGKKQVYDFDRYISIVRRLQSEAVIFNDYGPDVRWCGNEGGKSRPAEWAVVPSELCKYSPVQTVKGPLSETGSLSWIYNTHQIQGELPLILYSKGLTFTPAETNTSIHKGWFYHQEENPKSLEELFNIYMNSAGNNSVLNLNIPPNTEGLFAQRDIERLYEFNKMIQKEFSENRCIEWKKISGENELSEYELKVSCSIEKIKYLELGENIAEGQRIESFMVYSPEKGGVMFPLYEGRTAGYRKICMLKNPFEIQNGLLEESSSVKSDSDEVHTLFVKVTASRGEADIKSLKVF